MINGQKQINFFIDDELKAKVEEIKTEYNLSKIMRKLLHEFHEERFGKKQKKGNPPQLAAGSMKLEIYLYRQNSIKNCDQQNNNEVKRENPFLLSCIYLYLLDRYKNRLSI